MYEVLFYIAVGFIGGIITSQYLPADVVNHYSNRLKIKKSTVTETDISQTSLFPVEEKPKKPGIFKRIFKRKTIKNERLNSTGK